MGQLGHEAKDAVNMEVSLEVGGAGSEHGMGASRLH